MKLELDIPFQLFSEEWYQSRISDILLIIGKGYELTVCPLNDDGKACILPLWNDRASKNFCVIASTRTRGRHRQLRNNAAQLQDSSS